MTLQFSDEALFKIQLEWDPTDVEIQILPEGAPSYQVQEIQEEPTQPSALNPLPLDTETSSQDLVQADPISEELPEVVQEHTEGSTLANEVMSETKRAFTEESTNSTESAVEATEENPQELPLITEEVPFSQNIPEEQNTPISAETIVMLDRETASPASEEPTETYHVNIIEDPKTEEPIQLPQESIEETKVESIDLNNAPDEKNRGVLETEAEPEHNEALSEGDNEETATLIESEPPMATASKSITPKSATPTKAVKSQNAPAAARKPKPIKKPIGVTAVSEPNLKKVVSSPPRIVKKPSLQTLPRSTSSLSRQSSVSSRSSHSFNRASSQTPIPMKGARQTSLGSLSHSPIPSPTTPRRADPQRLKSQIDFSHGSTAHVERPKAKADPPSTATFAHKIPSRQEIAARHLSTSFSIGNEEGPSTSAKSAPPAWAK